MSPALDPYRDDPYLSLPLDGVRAIEASAGTGKTFTLATLVTRLVVERGLRIGEILAVTFTEAATQELRARIRARLLLAASLIGREAVTAESPEAGITRALLDAHRTRTGETEDALHRRLRLAADGIDLASVFTIHGFCTRVLRDYAFESGQGFDAPEVLASDQPLLQQVAADLWRAHGRDAIAAEDLFALWKGGPEALAKTLGDLLREERLLPAADDLPADPDPALHAAAGALMTSLDAHGQAFQNALLAGIENKALNAGSYKSDWVQALFDALRAWRERGDSAEVFEHDKLHKLSGEELAKGTKKGCDAQTPASPLQAVIADYRAALEAKTAYREVRQALLLHRLREDGRQRLANLKRQRRVQTFDDLINGVADALDAPGGKALAERLRTQYRVALVDEFQDTDPRQWRIFDRVFGRGSAAPALFVIGDPKQAIYGFRGGDVDTYLAARQAAEQAPPLAHNFRSRPVLLRAIEALYANAQAAFEDENNKAATTPPFVDPRIAFHAIAAGGLRGDDDFQRNGAPAPALTLWQAPPTGDVDSRKNPTAWKAPQSRDMATAACVAAIHGVLSDARNGKAVLKDKQDGLRAVQPGDIAVLVRSHHEATLIRQALALAGVPAVAAGKQSLFATSEARELHTLLLALQASSDTARLRAALATVLVGQGAADIAALVDIEAEADHDRLRDGQLQAFDWRERLLRGGPLALVSDLCAARAAHIIGLLDGERRLTNYLQLAEQLQVAQAGVQGLSGLVDWLARAITRADANDETQLLRLESDARRVQIVTLHKSKGLEYPLVYLPFAGIGKPVRAPTSQVVVNGDAGRTLHWNLCEDASGWNEAKQRWQDAERADAARLLYVGLTRARDALWIATGPFYSHGASPLAQMIGDSEALQAALGNALHRDADPPASALPWLPPEDADVVAPARKATRPLRSDWWVYSFTQLAHAEGGQDRAAAATLALGAASDEPVYGESPVDAVASSASVVSDPRFSGSRFGNVLHAALEHADFAAWGAWRAGDPAPPGQAAGLQDALRAEGYAEAEWNDGVALLTSLVGHTLTVPLPEGGALHTLPDDARRAEIEFHFALQPTEIDTLLQLLHAHGVARGRSGFGLRRRLEGLMTGKIDLTYVRDGRWYVLDYKSNRLAHYDADSLAQAMAHSEYDLQALIYTLALHRWLRFRRGVAYDYARDFGGIRYLFCRGLRAGEAGSPGVYAQTLAPALVQALDALFGGPAHAATGAPA